MKFMKTAFVRIVGIALIVAGLVAGYFWFYHWGPMRRVLDPAWYLQHSDAAYWEEYQKCLQRSGYTHDWFGVVGRFGDKQSVQWVMDHIQPDEDIVSCAVGHKVGGLRFLTNQDAGDSMVAWLAWWEQNKSKSQEDWIREGFRKYDVEIQTPLTPANIIALLKLAAPHEDAEAKPADCPDYLQYNAFRWLRDSDFDPDKFTVKDIPVKDADRVLQGLVRVARLSGEHPKYAGVGVLNLGERLDPPGMFPMKPMLLTMPFQIVANTIVFVSLGTGVLLLWLSFRDRRKTKTTVQEGEQSIT